MLDSIKRHFWDWIRPFHAPLTRALRRKLGRNYCDHPEMELPPPYDSVQLDVERHFHDYLHVKAEEISQIVIVGAHEGTEIVRLHHNYPRAHLLCFEPNPRTCRQLRENFHAFPYVSISELALSKSPGIARFFELPMPGNGSLLEPDMESWGKFVHNKDRVTTSFDVNVSTLDRETAGLSQIDLLWMDVQGAEGDVLAGAGDALKRTQSVFIEVAMVRSPYKGALLFPELAARLESEGFTCVGLGVDAWNGTGNAFFVSRFDGRICK